jgi:photosystem II stability/assembly factor-like uncharacterized protein
MKLGASIRGTGCLLLVAAFFFGTCNAARAQERVAAIKMLAPGVGWAIKGSGLFWTSSNGAKWTDITPPAPSMAARMSSVFFLNTSVGWVLFARGGDDPLFDLASTTNAGASWSVTPVSLPPLDRRYSPIIGGARLAFADPAHGWMSIVEEGGAAFAPGMLAMTTDAGRTWRWAPKSPGICGSLVAVTLDELWLAGGPDNTNLYVTYDRAKSWRKIKLPAPKEIEPATGPTYDIPTFLDPKRGFEPVTFTGPGFRGAAVLFVTIDGGRTWRADRMLTNLAHVSGGEIVASAVVDSTWIVRTSDANTLRLGAGSTTQVKESGRLTTGAGENEVSFSTPAAGWITTPDGRLNAAGESGSASNDITPGELRLSKQRQRQARLDEFPASQNLSVNPTRAAQRLSNRRLSEVPIIPSTA